MAPGRGVEGEWVSLVGGPLAAGGWWWLEVCGWCRVGGFRPPTDKCLRGYCVQWPDRDGSLRRGVAGGGWEELNGFHLPCRIPARRAATATANVRPVAAAGVELLSEYYT